MNDDAYELHAQYVYAFDCGAVAVAAAAADDDYVVCVSANSLCTLSYPTLNPQTMQCIDFYLSMNQRMNERANAVRSEKREIIQGKNENTMKSTWNIK